MTRNPLKISRSRSKDLLSTKGQKPKPRSRGGFLQKTKTSHAPCGHKGWLPARLVHCRSSAALFLKEANDKQSAEDLPKPLKRFAFYQRAKTKTSLTGWLPTKNQNLARTLSCRSSAPRANDKQSAEDLPKPLK
ncbi:hypothetical protein, partial [uncultured Neptuniibacter sp.]|uniref:hypothetical protein n=1 Tax=uncultured Neptuniibacter sp. TaxID=502143 RepID=UPI0032B10B59